MPTTKRRGGVTPAIVAHPPGARGSSAGQAPDVADDLRDLRVGEDEAEGRHAGLAQAGSAVADHLGTRPDVVIDVTSSDPEAVFTAMDLVRSGGTVVLASTKGNRPLHFLSDVIVSKQITVKGALGASSDSYEWACKQVESDPRIDRLVSHQFPLSESARALQAAAGMLGHDELISVAVTF